MEYNTKNRNLSLVLSIIVKDNSVFMCCIFLISITRAFHSCFPIPVDLFFEEYLRFMFLDSLCCRATLRRFKVQLDEYLPAKTGSMYVRVHDRQVTFNYIFIIVTFYVLCSPVCMALICLNFYICTSFTRVVLLGELQRTRLFCFLREKDLSYKI